MWPDNRNPDRCPTKAAKGGLGLIEGEPTAGRQSREHSGTSADVNEGGRLEVGYEMTELLALGTNDFRVSVDAQTCEVPLGPTHRPVVVGSTSVVVVPE
jgi:hypothetical protein